MTVDNMNIFVFSSPEAKSNGLSHVVFKTTLIRVFVNDIRREIN